MSIKAVIFDFGGTLAEGGLEVPPFEVEILLYLRSLGYRVSLTDVRGSQRAALDRLQRVRSRRRELSFKEVYKEFLRKLNIPQEEEVLDDLYELYRKNFIVNLIPGVEDLLKRLSEKYKLAILSNIMSDIPRRFLAKKGLGEIFEVVVCSSDVGVRKPDERAFRYVLDQIGLSPKESVFVGDSLEADIEGARMVGMTAIWVRGDREEGVSNLEYSPNYIIKSVLELPLVMRKIEKG